MIDTDLIHRLAAEGRTQREIADATGYSKGMVYRILNGSRRQRMRSNIKVRDLDAPYERCGGCGGRVQMPCVACEVLCR
jgi:transcriptional regulator with XRE-family HTH domain